MTDWRIWDLVVITFQSSLETEIRYKRTNPAPGTVVIDLVEETSGGTIRDYAREYNFPTQDTPKDVTLRPLAPAPVGYKAVARLYDATMNQKDITDTHVISGILVDLRGKRKPAKAKSRAKPPASQVKKVAAKKSAAKKSSVKKKSKKK